MRVSVVAALLFASALGACSSGPDIIEFDEPLPSCDAFAATVAGLGMPDPVLLTRSSPQVSQTDLLCRFAPRNQVDPPALASASIQVSRPNFKSDEQDPRKRYGGLIADVGCQGIAAPDAELPGGTSCVQIVGDEIAMTSVSAVTTQAGIRADVYWTEADVVPEKLEADALAKARGLANAVIEKL